MKDINIIYSKAIEFFKSGDFLQAEICCIKILSINNFQPSTLNLMGNIELKRTNYLKAIEWFKCTIISKPDLASAYSNLGNALKLSGNISEAINNYNKAILLDSTYSDAYSNLGGAYFVLNRFDDSIQMCRQALVFNPNHQDALQNLGAVYLKINDKQNAFEIYQKLSSIAPKNKAASYIFSVLRGDAVNKPPQEYIRKLFDGYANSFENHLINKLNYILPQQLINLLRLNKKFEVKKSIALDIGCGTGLIGSLINNNFDQLIGVDLSSKMLEKANESGFYTRLTEKDILEFIQTELNNTYDLVIACDTLIYFGNLQQLFKSIKLILKNEGTFAFTIEKLFDSNFSDFKLTDNGRYQHNEVYINQMITENRFNICDMKECIGRKERGNDVLHLMYILTK